MIDDSLSNLLEIRMENLYEKQVHSYKNDSVHSIEYRQNQPDRETVNCPRMVM